jgi:hypothetical protein
MNGPKGYEKLKRKLAGKGWRFGGPLLSVDDVKAKPGYFSVWRLDGGACRSLYFRTMRQVQRWADSGFKSPLPAIELEDGSVVEQKSVA